MGTYDNHKLLIANRGEIAVRIIRTAKRLGLRTVAIYTPSDSLSPHVLQADEAVSLPSATPATSEANAYLTIPSIISVCIKHSVTLVHPGYGFLSENAEFAAAVVKNGIGWVGPRPDIIKLMGIKHAARRTALAAGLAVVPGSDGLVASEEEALEVARQCGFPVMLKATAGGGGMGMVICRGEEDLKKSLSKTKDRAQVLFSNDGVFLEKYFEDARHVEVQVFGNGLGDVVHMRERECSVQRRHQKVIEETPSPFCSSHIGLREKMCEAAVVLARSIKYESAGTVEFLVDEHTAEFYFLEMNTRIQVEHAITEMVHPGLDIIELMIKQSISERAASRELTNEMDQATYDELYRSSQLSGKAVSIEGRVYAENPYEEFTPAPGLLQYVSLNALEVDWLRVDSWVETGMTITPYFDPLLAKVVVTGSTREEAISRFVQALESCAISGPPNNLQYLKAVAQSDKFAAGLVTTRFLQSFSVAPHAFKVISAGIETTIQDLPGRTQRMGIPRSGPMDDLAFAAANILVGNDQGMEGLEIIVVPGVGCSFQFFLPTTVAVTGKDVVVKVNGTVFPTWSKVSVPKNGKVEIEALPSTAAPSGLRNYLSVRGGFPDIPKYLGSKSTSMGLGGYQGRPLMKGDQIMLGKWSSSAEENQTGSHPLAKEVVPSYPSHWVVYVLSGPQGDEEYVTAEGIQKFYSTKWLVSSSSNRLGIRLQAPDPSDKVQWAREDGGEGGSHPSNILDNGYAPGTININGDTPVILTNEGPDMGGYMCMCTVATSEMWKLGQLSPGSSVEFRRISWDDATKRSSLKESWLRSISLHATTRSTANLPTVDPDTQDVASSPIMHVDARDTLQATFRQAGDSAILVEFGTMRLDIFVRARIHAFQHLILEKGVNGVIALRPCIRSILCHYNPKELKQAEFLQILIDCQRDIPEDLTGMKFSGRRFTFPIVLDDKWNREALQRYMATVRDKAVYLPSNVDYLAKNNGLSSSSEALQKLVGSDWLIVGVGFYLACPFLVPIDPRCRLIGQKMNPSRTFTPRGAIGVAGPVAAIYPIESPGGYQLYGRTLPAWQTWGKGVDFQPTKPWLLDVFDQIHFVPVKEEEYLKFERQFDAGQYIFQVEPVVLSMEEYSHFLSTIEHEVSAFKKQQSMGRVVEEATERDLLRNWEESKQAAGAAATTSVFADAQDGSNISASLFATVWKIKCQLGDIIQLPSDVLMILEAMKTEIPVLAGEDHVGKTVRGFGSDMKEGVSVRPGDILVVFS